MLYPAISELWTGERHLIVGSESKVRPFTGAKFLESLRDSREACGMSV